MKNLKTFEGFEFPESDKFTKEDFQKISNQAQGTMIVFADTPMIGDQEGSDSRELYADIDDLHNNQETLSDESILLTDKDGEPQEVSYADISWIEIDGGERITLDDLR